ncbi:MAG: M35 family metallo-endopeptidase [Rhodobacteraceae bacterium]|nr:M35 family metallo-endopeptidase [Paracoccaceae bacterium]
MLKQIILAPLMIFSLLLTLAPPAQAGFLNCSAAQQSDIEKALFNAFDALSAATVQITPQNGAYQSWFGRWEPARAKKVRTTLSALKNHIRIAKITYVCEPARSSSCDAGTFAFVYPNDSGTIYLCPPYFGLPLLSDATFLEVFNSGTRAGTLIHEMSHYEDVGDTDDRCYNRDVCSSFARTSPGGATINADSYQYFAEDAYLKSR